MNVPSLFFLLWHLDPRTTITLLKLSCMPPAKHPFFTHAKKIMNIAAIVFSERAILSLPKTRVEPKWVVCSSKPDRSVFLLLLPHL